MNRKQSITRKQRSLCRKMHEQMYREEMNMYHVNGLTMFRAHYKTVKAGINTLSEYYQKLYLRLKEKEEAKKHYLEVELPKIKERNKRQQAAYLAAIGKG